ncbi:MAG TPA: hypothetical protein VJ183_10350 [Chloroflexia bacterium]|nr:hypothetical protein [Chloroflexia bacterium]
MEPRIALVLDGFNSNSLAHLSLKLSEAAIGRPVRPFSYYSVGFHYYWLNTWSSLLKHAKRLARYYITPEVDQIMVPIGASGGGLVALLGTAVWVEICQLRGWDAQSIVKSVPKLILIAPAFCPPAKLLMQYKEIYDLGRKTNIVSIPEVPMAVRQICDQSHEIGRRNRARIIDALYTLKGVGMVVDMLYWPHDEVCPYPCPEAGDIQQALEDVITPHPVLPSALRLPTNEMEAVITHVNFLRHTDTATIVQSLLP